MYPQAFRSLFPCGAHVSTFELYCFCENGFAKSRDIQRLLVLAKNPMERGVTEILNHFRGADGFGRICARIAINVGKIRYHNILRPKLMRSQTIQPIESADADIMVPRALIGRRYKTS